MPETEEGKQQIVEALVEHCANQQHVTRVLRQFIRTVEECRNIVVTLIRIAEETLPLEEPPDGCEKCLDPNWLPPDHPLVRCLDRPPPKWVNFLSIERNGYSAAARCTCPRGRWFRQKDRENDTGQKAEPTGGLRTMLKVVNGPNLEHSDED
jgi:hypothetical protein